MTRLNQSNTRQSIPANCNRHRAEKTGILNHLFLLEQIMMCHAEIHDLGRSTYSTSTLITTKQLRTSTNMQSSQKPNGENRELYVETPFPST